MEDGNANDISVHVHHKIGQGQAAGNYDFWTLVLEHPILSGIASALIYDIMKMLAMKAVELLKRAKTKAKRVDMMIPFDDQDWVVVRVISRVPPNVAEAGIPNVEDVYLALTSATSVLMSTPKRKQLMPKVVSAEIHITTGPGQLWVNTTGSGLGSPLKEQIAKAKSEKPIMLQVKKTRRPSSHKV